MTLAWISIFLALGVLGGCAYFVVLARDANALTHGGAIVTVIGLRLGRFAIAIALLVFAARLGWPMLIAAAVGFMVARQIILSRLGSGS